MALTAWNRELGTTQGRVQPLGFVPPQGEFAFVLGRDLPGLMQKLEVCQVRPRIAKRPSGAVANFMSDCVLSRTSR